MAAMDLNFFGAPDFDALLAAERRRARIARRIARVFLFMAVGALAAAVYLAAGVLGL